MQDIGVDKVFIDRTSGKHMDRPELKKLLDFVLEGDTVIVESISRFARPRIARAHHMDIQGKSHKIYLPFKSKDCGLPKEERED